MSKESENAGSDVLSSENTTSTQPLGNQEADLRSLAYIPMFLCNVYNGWDTYHHKYKTWSTSPFSHKLIILVGIACAVVLPFLFYNSIQAIRQYKWKPYTRMDFWSTVAGVWIGVCVLLVLLLLFHCFGARKDLIVMSAIVFGMAILGVMGYAGFQWRNLDEGVML